MLLQFQHVELASVCMAGCLSLPCNLQTQAEPCSGRVRESCCPFIWERNPKQSSWVPNQRCILSPSQCCGLFFFKALLSDAAKHRSGNVATLFLWGVVIISMKYRKFLYITIVSSCPSLSFHVALRVAKQSLKSQGYELSWKQVLYYKADNSTGLKVFIFKIYLPCLYNTILKSTSKISILG